MVPAGLGVPQDEQPFGAQQASSDVFVVVVEPAVTSQRVGNVSIKAARA